MSGATANLSKTSGHALVVGTGDCREQPRRVLSAIGYHTDSADDPYAAILELCRRPLVYRALVLSLQSIYRDELAVIPAVRRRFPHVSIWLTHTDGRAATLAEAMRLGAEALISDDGIHPFGKEAVAPPATRPLTFRAVPPSDDPSSAPAEPDADQPPAGGQVEGSTSRAASVDGSVTASPNDMNNPVGRPPANRSPVEPVLTAAELHALLGDSNA